MAGTQFPLIVGWLIIGPLIAAASVDIAANVLRGSSTGAGSPLGAAVVLAVASGATALYLKTRRAPV